MMLSLTRSLRFRSVCLISGLIILCVSSSVGYSQDDKATSPLRYKWEKGQVFTYSVEITADLNDKIETMKGVITYTVNSVNDAQLKVTSRGGLQKSQKAKPGKSVSSSRSRFGGRSPFGPRSRGRASFPSRARGPFASVPFKGLVTSNSNQITLTPRGMTQTMKGDSQLPYLIGNLSLLVFEPLPDEATKSWELKSGITITKKNERQTGPPFFIPRRGFPFSQEEPEEQTAASQAVSFKIEKDDGKQVTANKTYQLKSPKTDDGSYEITGSGKWVFNRELGVSESLDFKQKLIIHSGNVAVTIPVTIKYHRLSGDELAAHQAKQKAAQEASRKRLAELQAKRAKAQAKKDATPLTAKEKKDLLDKLRSDKFSVLAPTLQRMQRRTPKNPDQDVAKAVVKLFDHNNRLVQRLAKQVAKKWPVTE